MRYESKGRRKGGKNENIKLRCERKVGRIGRERERQRGRDRDRERQKQRQRDRELVHNSLQFVFLSMENYYFRFQLTISNLEHFLHFERTEQVQFLPFPLIQSESGARVITNLLSFTNYLLYSD